MGQIDKSGGVALVTRGQRILLWAVAIGAFVIGLLGPTVIYITEPGRFGTPSPGWFKTYLYLYNYYPIYPLATLVGIVTTYMALRKI
jgi:hypothetical protein